MSDIAIRVENLGKKYSIRHEQQGRRYKALRDVLSDGVKGIFNPKSQVSNPSMEEFWAVRDVSFEIKQGEAVGIIGRNGAGKSTLLKLLSRITEPSKGRIELDGRIASLLEVGTGFHPELTGRENIYLNAAILGMKRDEIRKKFDEIVDFAEIEKFLDTPVKRYSTGMYMRLAFAIAAHLEPEILIIDEVLAVGDAQFQKKCLGKMQDVSAKEGRTVLFVSHQMGMISKLCTSGIHLRAGKVYNAGKISSVLSTYLEEQNSQAEADLLPSPFPDAACHFKELQLSHNNSPSRDFLINQSIKLEALVAVTSKSFDPKETEICFSLLDSYGRRIFSCGKPFSEFDRQQDEYRVNYNLEPGFLAPGNFSWMCILHVPDREQYQLVPSCLPFSVKDLGSFYSRWEGRVDVGVVFPKGSFNVRH